MMTQIKEKAVEMIQRLPDDKMIYIVNILQNLEALSSYETKQEDDVAKAREAFIALEGFRKKLPADFDYKEELAKARDEKYENID
jgi:hypothetical protein